MVMPSNLKQRNIMANNGNLGPVVEDRLLNLNQLMTPNTEL